MCGGIQEWSHLALVLSLWVVFYYWSNSFTYSSICLFPLESVLVVCHVRNFSILSESPKFLAYNCSYYCFIHLFMSVKSVTVPCFISDFNNLILPCIFSWENYLQVFKFCWSFWRTIFWFYWSSWLFWLDYYFHPFAFFKFSLLFFS